MVRRSSRGMEPPSVQHWSCSLLNGVERVSTPLHMLRLTPVSSIRAPHTLTLPGYQSIRALHTHTLPGYQSVSSVLERVRHDSVSTVVFKFQAHHLFHISSLMFKSSDSERLHKFSEGLVEFWLYLFKARARSRQKIRRTRRSEDHVRKSKRHKLFRLASQPCDLY